jgi:hypothetical protein
MIRRAGQVLCNGDGTTFTFSIVCLSRIPLSMVLVSYAVLCAQLSSESQSTHTESQAVPGVVPSTAAGERNKCVKDEVEW